MVYESNESGELRSTYGRFRDLAGNGRFRPQVEALRGWSPDGKELYYIGPDGKMMAVPIVTTDTTLQPGTPVALFQTRIFGAGGQLGRQYDIVRDGRFLINTVLDEAAAPITLLQNWKPPSK